MEYIRAVGAAVALSALMDMLVPDGGFKKYCRLVCGFMVISVLLSPVTGGTDYTPEAEDGLSPPDTEAAVMEARARVLLEHRANLEEMIEDTFPGCRAYVEVDGEGNVTRVDLSGVTDEAAARDYVQSVMGAEDVNINEDKGAT